MRNKTDKRIDFPAPFLKEDTVLYVSHETGLFRTVGMCRYAPEMALLFRDAGKKLVFLPDLLGALHPDLLEYLFPGQDFPMTEEDLSHRLVERVGADACPGFLYREGRRVYFHPIAAPAGGRVLDEVRDFALSLSIEMAPPLESAPGTTRFRKESKCREAACKKKEPSFFDLLFSAESEEEREQVVLDPRAQAILDAWSKIEREFGITIEGLEMLLGYKVQLSRLTITLSNRMFLTDFGDREVKMDDLTKALYFFYLRHPEGARLKELQEHEEEILHIYSGITGRDDVEGIRSSVHNRLDPFGNDLNVSLSRIKKAFRDVVGDRIARFYYVYGSSGKVRTVGLDRDLVIWEH